ncbi:MAG: AAA family ATPase, partial [Lachnospiraceae bacterium]|nr:AAA family ATPase [Lachnospiraceae bacterium]
MDKYEYKVRAQEIRDLIAANQYEKAAEIADTIDWSRVKKSTFLCTISDLYKINKRYEDAIELLQLAYDRYPGGKDILYSLCELYLSTGDTIRAISTYKEFCQVAGNDIRKYILQYKVYVAQEVSLEERIEVLEELKKRDYREKWAYTLAYLYHRVGLATKCVEECDELISWFGEGKYVDMAMELKMLHQPLDEKQQEL